MSAAALLFSLLGVFRFILLYSHVYEPVIDRMLVAHAKENRKPILVGENSKGAKGCIQADIPPS